MAYDALREKNRQDDGHGDNPYEPAVGSYGSVSAPAQGAPSRTPPPGPPTMGAGGPTATGHVNFDQIYDANAGTAAREANKRASAAEQAGQKAQAGLTGAQQAFSGSARTGAGPSASQYQYATGQKQFFGTQQPQAAGAPQNALQQREQPANVVRNASTEADWRAQLEAGANAKYAGPDSLQDTAGYDELLKQTVAAQDLANNPLTGMSDLDRALLGAAGRPRLEDVKSKYGHVADDLDKANAASVEQGKAMRAAAGEANDAYSRLLSQYDAQQAEQKAAEAANAPKVIAAAPGVGNANDSVGLSPDVSDQVIHDYYADKGLGDVRGGQPNINGHDQITGQWARFFGVDEGLAQDVLDALTDSDWVDYQKAIRGGAQGLRDWFAVMRQKYGV